MYNTRSDVKRNKGTLKIGLAVQGERGSAGFFTKRGGVWKLLVCVGDQAESS